jgi:hypothetical protein
MPAMAPQPVILDQYRERSMTAPKVDDEIGVEGKGLD